MKTLKVTIIGIGLIGGSLGLAIRKKAAGGIRVTGFDADPASLSSALENGAVDEQAADLSAAAAGADIIFFCTPVLQIPQLVEQVLPYLRPGVILTDVGSTKVFLQQRLAALLPPGICYIGGHPMAGREKSGLSAANDSLFEDKLYILTPPADTPAEAVETVEWLIGLTGARVTVMEVERHDKCAAVISHIPHVAAAALVNLLAGFPGQEQEMLKLAGGGFGDTTRIASSNADMWADICMTNAAAINDGLEQLTGLLNNVRQAITAGDRAALHSYFAQAKKRRDSIIASL